MTKKVLIIGGTGFIGYHLAKKCLEKKYDFIIMYYHIPQLSGFETADIIRKNENTLTVNHTISHNENAIAGGPITVLSGVTLTIEGNLSIV